MRDQTPYLIILVGLAAYVVAGYMWWLEGAENSWPVVDAEITEVGASTGKGGYYYPYYCYSYKEGGETYTGKEYLPDPYLSEPEALDSLGDRKVDETVQVRCNPNYPEQSTTNPKKCFAVAAGATLVGTLILAFGVLRTITVRGREQLQENNAFPPRDD